MLTILAYVNWVWAGSWVCLAPISQKAEAFFDVGPGAVSQFANVFMLTFPLSSFLALWTVNTWGVKPSVALSVTGNLANVFIRWLPLGNWRTSFTPAQAYWLSLVSQARSCSIA